MNAEKPKPEPPQTKHPLRRKRGYKTTASYRSRPIENGPFGDELIEFINTISVYQQINCILFPAHSELFEIMLYLGYRQTKPKAKDIDKIER